jgi:RHH-type transcriptional regulator, proline utilization regulon repressor / proline dehydrogenase / delta 1-pyrroline-5-carboxylate dehydrogenase
LALSRLPGPLILAQSARPERHLALPCPYDLVWLMEEVAVSINTSAAGGNANLMTLG